MSLSIEVRFLGGLTTSQQAIFESAAARWMRIITADLPPVRVNGEEIGGVVIEAQGTLIDGPGQSGRNILGQALPTVVREPSLLPAMGLMQFDTFDLMRLEVAGQLESVIVHEMGHVLGIGSLWRQHGLLRRLDSDDPVFVGPMAEAEWGRLIGAARRVPVPVANVGGAGSRGVHWRESVLMNELMTPSLNDRTNPISRVTIASLKDLGYQVDLDVADDFPFSSPQLVLLGDGPAGEFVTYCSCGSLQRPPIQPVLVPEIR